MPLETWLAFLGASALLLVLPGPTILTVISYSITHGRRARLPLVLAVALGDSTALLLSQVGLGALLSASAFWFTVVKTVGGLYLLYLGFKLLRRRGAALPQAGEAGSRWKLFANTYLVTALNPKGIIFFVAFLPQFIDPAGDTVRQMWILSATFVTCAGLNAAAYALFAGQARRLLASPRARFNLGGGALLSPASGAAGAAGLRPAVPVRARPPTRPRDRCRSAGWRPPPAPSAPRRRRPAPSGPPARCGSDPPRRTRAAPGACPSGRNRRCPA